MIAVDLHLSLVLFVFLLFTFALGYFRGRGEGIAAERKRIMDALAGKPDNG